jgi:hypothetical protein
MMSVVVMGAGGDLRPGQRSAVTCDMRVEDGEIVVLFGYLSGGVVVSV